MKKTNLFLSRLLLAATVITSVTMGLSQSRPSSTRQYITGRIISKSTNKPIRAIWVTILESNIPKGRAVTGDDGKYYIGSLDEKIYKIVVQRGGVKILDTQVRLPQNRNYDISLNQ